jgi:YhcH/YjgK/YiaL family protein
MVLDSLESAGRYWTLHTMFPRAFEFLRNLTQKELPSGRYEIEGEKAYGIIALERGKRREEAGLEAHRRYIDIQCCLEGTETMGWKPTAECRGDSEGYSEERDIEFFRGRPQAWITLTPGRFAIFFPEDAHAPLVAEGWVRKVVVKVLV